MKTRVLVLGANGYVGQAVVRALRDADWAEPVAGVRGASRVPDVATQRLDATDRGALAAALRDVDAVVNCVAGAPATMVAGAQALHDVLAERGGAAPRVVHFSSMAVYGAATGRVDETQPIGAALSPYGAAKARCEELLAPLPNRVVLRPGCVYGADSPQWSVRIARLLCARRLGDLGAAGDGCSNLVHVDDVVAAVLQALRAPAAAGQTFNLAMADAPRWNAYFETYALALRAVPLARIGGRRLRVETRLLAPALKIAEIAARRLRLDARHLPPPIPPSLARLWAQDIRLDASRAEAILGLRWTPLADGVARSVA